MALPLHRHQLLRLSRHGWTRVLRAAHDDARACLELWAGRDLPLVVTRQPEATPADRIATGLPAPARLGRRRLALEIDAAGVAGVGEFPPGLAACDVLQPGALASWRDLMARLAVLGCAPRVYGGHGWQCLTGLAYLHEGSDIDLLLPVTTPAHADAVCAALATSDGVVPRLDGELLFPTGEAIAWREWLGCREGRADRVLVKRLRDVTLARPETLFSVGAAC